jgi:hypothetical protein
MARPELLDIASAVAGSFVSRNNDVDGYWALGLLRSYADRHGLRSLRFDILQQDPESTNDVPALVGDAYRQVLVRQLAIRKIGRELVAKAEIFLTFGADAPDTSSASTYGAPFSCTVRLTDQRGREFERVRAGCCALHDPSRELRSVRGKSTP